MTGGSADGNAMIFFKDNALPLLQSEIDAGIADNDKGVRVVTTTLTVGQQQIEVARGGQTLAAEARSYIFSVASNKPIDKDHPALVLYYDRDAP